MTDSEHLSNSSDPAASQPVWPSGLTWQPFAQAATPALSSQAATPSPLPQVATPAVWMAQLGSLLQDLSGGAVAP